MQSTYSPQVFLWAILTDISLLTHDTMTTMHPFFGRTELLIGTEGLQCLQRSRVALFGLGGVGSYAAEALVRSGIGYLRIVDFDRVGASNFNRQLYALQSTLGQQKAEIASARLLDINPELELDARAAFFHTDSADALLEGPLDFVIDAIDSLNPKCELLVQCVERGIPMISAMGAAARTDPTALRYGSVWETDCCPLARKVRKMLRRRGVTAPIPVVYSLEAPYETFAAEEVGEVQSEQYYQRGRPRRILPSMAMLPGIIGLMAANYVVQQLTARTPVTAK